MSRRFLDTRLVLDLFGPLLDISRIDTFADVDARYKTEDQIAEALIRKRVPVPRANGDADPPAKRWTPSAVLGLTKEWLSQPKLALHLIDADVVHMLCHAAEFCEVVIVSAVPDASLFEAARELLIRYSALRHPVLCQTPDTPGVQLTTDNFFHEPNATSTGSVAAYLLHSPEPAKYTIVVDDQPPFSLSGQPELHLGVNYDRWISGAWGNTSISHELAEELQHRRRVADTSDALRVIAPASSEGNSRHKLQISSYRVSELESNFYVFDEQARNGIENQLASIRKVLNGNVAPRPPVCVFLAGPPGSGKSYFFKMCLEALEASGDWPTTSLSGVPARKFAQAVETHIEKVYNLYTGDQSASAALLDEVDTVARDETAYRLLMDAMTGSRTDDMGLSMAGVKSGQVGRLVWFFAGSSARSRQDFIDTWSETDKKVADFFDRVHFYVELPGVETAGQSILQALSLMKRYFGEDGTEVKIDLDVLRLFGATPWTSTRQITTVCWSAASRRDIAQPRAIAFEDFKDLGSFEGFHSTYVALEEARDKRPSEAREGDYVQFKWSVV